MKILITGGSGNLGNELRALMHCDAPALDELDVTNPELCIKAIHNHRPDIVIHCAAWTDVARAEIQKAECWRINVEGTENMVRATCAQGDLETARRFIYISTDYVFDGEKGNYREDDIPNPQNFYSLTKLAGELIVRQYPRSLVIRTAFKKNGPWTYPAAFVDQWTSHEFVSKLAPEILQAAVMMDLVGVIHIAGERKTVYKLARQASPEVGRISIRDVSVTIPRDTSLDSSRWHEIRLRHMKK